MTERPIIFSAVMVRALLEGRKTQTRRIIKDQPDRLLPVFIHDRWQWVNAGSYFISDVHLPFATGDRLWVREAWRSAAPLDDFSPSVIGEESMEIAPVRYEADGESVNWVEWRGHDAGRLRAGMHMPRWASRITLTVTDVRVQRLQDISEEDAVAEGCAGRLGPNPDFPDEWDPSPQEEFQALWQSIHGPGSWEANPWVAAITFTVEQRNIDEGAR